MIIKKSTKLGFTLAEVLITLVIIGVIAALTVPTLMKSTQNQEFVSGLKKANSTLQQALINIARNNDSTPGDYSFLSNVDFIDEFSKVANVVKKCNYFNDCFAPLKNGTSFTTLNNGSINLSVGKSVVTSDGQAISYYSMQPGDGVYNISNDDKANALGRIIVDINGHKNPNVIGRDIFILYVVNGKGIVPAGAAGQTSCVKTSSGDTCAAKVLKENAMNY